MNSFDSCLECPKRVVCQCLQITKGQLIEAIQTLELRTVKEVRRATGAGEGCTCCHADLRAYLEHHHNYAFSSPICSAK